MTRPRLRAPSLVIRRALAASMLAAVLASPQAVAAPLGIDKPLNLVADDITVDTSGAGLVARGHVQITYGPDRATADLLRLRRAPRTAELSGHVTVVDPQGRASGDTVVLSLTPTDQVSRVSIAGNAVVEGREYSLSADRIVADRASGHLIAQGNVNAFSAPDLIVTGDRASYDQRAQYAVVAGHAVASNKAGRLRGDRFELFRAEHRGVVHGPVEAEVDGATITGAGATVDLRRSVAIFTGRVVVTRRQGTLWADRVTMYYDTRRFVAEGATRARFNDLEDGTAP